MGRQSARLYYEGKDHKDIYFQGNYHNAMIVRKEGNAELVWRKMYDDGYFVYVATTLPAILYPKYRIREFCSIGQNYLNYSDKYLAAKYSYSSVGAIVSTDGKLWRMIKGNSKEVAVIPKGDGIVIVSYEASSQYKFTYVPCENGEINEDNALVIYSDAASGTKTDNTHGYFCGITDVCMMINRTTSPYQAFAVDMKGNKYDGLFAISEREFGGSGCYKGMYYCVITNTGNGGYVYVSKTIGGSWERRELPVKASDVYTIQSNDRIVVYLSRINGYTYSDLQVYTTTDFINYTRVDIPKSLCVPIIGPIYSGELEYVNYIFVYQVPKMENAYNYNVHIFPHSYLMNMSLNHICYIENYKIRPLKGMIIRHNITLINRKIVHITVCLDNLFFQESEGNFAFFEEIYPETYMNDSLKIQQLQQ